MKKLLLGLLFGPLLILLSHCTAHQGQAPLQIQVNRLKSDVQDQRQAGQKDTAQLQKQMEKLRGQLQDNEKITRQNMADQGVALDELRVELQNLRGKLEEIEYQIRKVQEERVKDVQLQEQTLNAVNEKLEQANLAPVAIAGALSAAEREKLKKLKDSEIYDRARLKMEKKEYDPAAALFQFFISERPKSKFADNAQYWLGECYYAQRKFERAILEFNKVVKNYPKSDKLCHSLLKQGFAFHELKKKKEGNAFLQEVIARCAKTIHARKAKERLAGRK